MCSNYAHLDSEIVLTLSHIITPAPTPDREEDFPYLIFAKRVSIHRVNLDGTELDTVIANNSFATNAIPLDFDARYAAGIPFPGEMYTTQHYLQ